jgi:MSHA biogenesis protein MshQ
MPADGNRFTLKRARRAWAPALALVVCTALAQTSAAAAAGFNAVDGYFASYPGGAAAQRIYTKLTGTGFTLNVAALNSAVPAGLVSPAYVSGTNKVTVDLVDDSDGSCKAACSGGACQGKPALATQVTSFATGDNSYKTGLSFTLANAYPNVRVRVKDTTNVPAVTSCSVDNFSVRPSMLTVTSSANADPSGASATATPVVKAGSTFTLTATASPGYGGTLSVNGTAVTANPLIEGTVAGTFGAANPSTGVATGNFTYTEAGYFSFNTDAVFDQSFTAIDQPGDCTPNYSNTLINGKYGCYFGNAYTTAFGRFIPDHFAIAAVSVTPACGTFSYFDQDGFITAFTVTAQNAANATTQNYTGSFGRLGLTSWAGFVFTGNTATPSASATVPGGTWNNGVAAVNAQHQVLARPTATPAAPVSLIVSARPVDPDGVTTAAPMPVMSVGTPVRFGVLALGSAYGSDLTTLRLPVTAMTWNGTAFVANTADTCTGAALNNASIALGNFVQKPGTSGAFSTSVVNPPTLASTWAQGAGSITLSAPGTAGTAQVALNLGSTSPDSSCIGWGVASTGSRLAWLRGNWCGASYAKDPSSLASFGTAATPYIYLRENH